MRAKGGVINKYGEVKSRLIAYGQWRNVPVFVRRTQGTGNLYILDREGAHCLLYGRKERIVLALSIIATG